MSLVGTTHLSLTTAGTSDPVAILGHSNSVGVHLYAAGTAKVQYTMFEAPTANEWIDWIYGSITASNQAIDLAPSVKFVRIVSSSGAADASVVQKGW